MIWVMNTWITIFAYPNPKATGIWDSGCLHYIACNGSQLDADDNEIMNNRVGQEVIILHKTLQGDHSGCFKPPVDTKTKAVFSTWASY